MKVKLEVGVSIPYSSYLILYSPYPPYIDSQTKGIKGSGGSGGSGGYAYKLDVDLCGNKRTRGNFDRETR